MQNYCEGSEHTRYKISVKAQHTRYKMSVKAQSTRISKLAEMFKVKDGLLMASLHCLYF